MLRAKIIKDMDKLIHDKKEGFYDSILDMYFENLNDWCIAKHGKKLVEVGL